MKNLINNWEQRIKRLFDEKKAVMEARSHYLDNSEKFATVEKSGDANWKTLGDIVTSEKCAGYEASVVRGEMYQYVKENRTKMTLEDFHKVCSLFSKSIYFLPKEEVHKKDHRGFFLGIEVSEDYLKDREIREKFEPWVDEYNDYKDRVAGIGKYAQQEKTEEKEEPKEELKEPSEPEKIEEAPAAVEEPKKEEPKEEIKETPKKVKKISKTAKEKIKREKRKIKKVQERERELRRIEREEKKLLAQQAKIAKELEKLNKKKLALLAKLKKGSEGSEGSNGQEGDKGGKTEGNKGNYEQGLKESSKPQKAKEAIKEEDKEEWKKAKSKIGARRRALTEQGFKRVLRDIANSKGEPKKVKKAIKKAKNYLEKIEAFEQLISETSKFASWAPGWFTRKNKTILKIQKLVLEWLEQNKEEEEKKQTPKKVKKVEGSEGSNNSEGSEGEEGDKGEEKEEPKEDLKESSEPEEVENKQEAPEAAEEIKEPEEENKEGDIEEEKEEPKEQKGNNKKEWRQFKREVGNKRRYIANYAEISYITARADWKIENIKGDLFKNYEMLKKGKKLIENFEDFLNSSKKFAPWAPKWFKKQAPTVWKIKRFVEKWIEANKKEIIRKAYHNKINLEEYKEEIKAYGIKFEEDRRISQEYWAKKTQQIKEEKERREREKEE